MVVNLNKTIFILILFFSLFSFSLLIDNKISNKDEEEKLLFVWEHFRHGARNPAYQVNNKTWKDFIGIQWQSQGELSPLGLRAHYLLGIATKEKYKNFLSKSFDTNEIFIISTDLNRTILSSMSNLQGIYSNYTTPNLTNEQISNAKIKGLNQSYERKINEKIEELQKSYVKDGISIIPLHIFSRMGLQFKLNDDDFCPGIEKFKNEAKNQEEVKRVLNDFMKRTNDTFGKYIFQFMNVSGETNPDYLNKDSNLIYICDSFVADYFAGRHMPHIIETGMDMEKFYNHCLNYSIIIIYYINYGSPPTKLSYLASSPIFRTIFNYMDRRIKLFNEKNEDKIEPSSPKFVIYSGHDSTIAGLDVFLKAEFNIEYETPVFTCSQIFELWHNKSGFFVKYLYNQKEKAVFELNDFKEKINQKLLPESEINEICGMDSGSDKNLLMTIEKESIYKKIFITVIGMTIISSGLLISVIILKRNNL